VANRKKPHARTAGGAHAAVLRTILPWLFPKAVRMPRPVSRGFSHSGSVVTESTLKKLMGASSALQLLLVLASANLLQEAMSQANGLSQVQVPP
jgi:hypothetical protein